MVKGISRQVIVLNSPEPKLFEQAIFILDDKAVKNGATDEALLKEARRLMSVPEKKRYFWYGLFWAVCGALITAAAWLLSVLL